MVNETEKAPTEPARVQCDPNHELGRALKASTAIRGAVAFPGQGNEAQTMAAALDIVDAFMSLAADMAASLQRSAAAHEATAHLMNIDLEATVAEGIRAGLEPAVNTAVKENAKRSFIGQKTP